MDGPPRAGRAGLWGARDDSYLGESLEEGVVMVMVA